MTEPEQRAEVLREVRREQARRAALRAAAEADERNPLLRRIADSEWADLKACAARRGEPVPADPRPSVREVSRLYSAMLIRLVTE